MHVLVPSALAMVQLSEAELREDTGLFFKRLGEICFSPANTQAFDGWSTAVATAAHAGAFFFADADGMSVIEVAHGLLHAPRFEFDRSTLCCGRQLAGVYAIHTAKLLGVLQKWNSDE